MRIDVPSLNARNLDQIVFHGASWDLYEAILRVYDEDPTRINYEEGTLEIMTLSFEHELFKRAIVKMVDAVIEEFDVPAVPGGSTTLKLEAQLRGLEADECYWVRNATGLNDTLAVDLSIHPPPDLVVEVDITHAVVDRESIYAKLGVAEMWHYDRKTLVTGWKLDSGHWTRIDRSIALPMVRPQDLNPFVEGLTPSKINERIKSFRAWLRSLPH